MATTESRLTPYLDQIRAVDFVKDARYEKVANQGDTGFDGVLKMRTPKGTFAFVVERKNSYLDKAVLNAFLVQAKYYANKGNDPLLLFARYIPRPSAERLIQSGVNFVDRVGNMHLVLGQNYERTIVGNKESSSEKADKSLTAAKVQFLFTLATNEKARNWTVRELADSAGLSKSNIAQLRQQFVREGIVRRVDDMYELRRGHETEELLIRGYEQVLRPRLLFNRFRSAESLPEKALDKMKSTLAELSVRWSLTGGLAAYALQRFYKGTDLILFLDAVSDQIVRQLRLLPDANGPITLLRGFGSAAYWKEVKGVTIAHPWLIYAELMRSPDPRAHEAATELKGEFLQTWSS
jgi:hypothetical protein